MKITIFDTETTGLLQKSRDAKLCDQPRIVQRGSLQMEYEAGMDPNELEFTNQIDELFNPGVPIPRKCTEVHGISDDMVKEKPNIYEFIHETVLPMLEESDLIICHNVAYDMNVLWTECLRMGKWYGKPSEKLMTMKEKTFCTMEHTTELLKIPGSYGRKYKFPKLQELHIHCFGMGFDGAHNAFADVEATARCFAALVKKDVFQLQEGGINVALPVNV